MKQNDFLKKSNLSLEDIENTDSEILQRISNDLAKPDVVGLSHGSHSSSSGRGHSSYVSGYAASKKSSDKTEQEIIADSNKKTNLSLFKFVFFINFIL